jgi:hypothetical protein
VLDVATRGERHVDGVELHDLAGLGGLGGLEQALGEAAFCGPFSGTRSLTQGGLGLDGSALDEMGENAPDGGLPPPETGSG